jgi:hypothetical protein
MKVQQMRQFFLRHRKNMLLRALYSGSILSLFIYAILRVLSYDFPMTWTEEITFFLKTFLCGCFLIATATGGSAWMYKLFLKMKHR